MTPAVRLREIHACSDAVEWVEAHPRLSAALLWATCPHGDWLLWIATRYKVEHRLLVLAACDCAQTALAYVPAGEDSPRHAVETAEAWARGEATLDQVRHAANDAGVTACNVARFGSGFPAHAAAAVRAAASAADAVYDARFAASAAFATEHSHAHSYEPYQCANLVRKRISWDTIAPLWEAP